MTNIDFEYSRTSWVAQIGAASNATVKQVYSSMATSIRQFLRSGGGGYIPRRTGELRSRYSVQSKKSRSLGRQVFNIRNTALPRRLAGSTKSQGGRNRATRSVLAGREAGRYPAILENAQSIRGYNNRHYRAAQNAVSRNWDKLLAAAIPIAQRKAQQAAAKEAAKAQVR